MRNKCITKRASATGYQDGTTKRPYKRHKLSVIKNQQEGYAASHYDICMRIHVGTAQFGNLYGITNENIKLSPKLCWQMLDLALENGVNEVDTAPTYGNAMDILAKYRGGRLNVTSKLKVKGLSTRNIVDSLKKQENKIGKFHILRRVLIHDFSSLNSEELRMLQRFKETYDIGASIYESKELALVKKYIGKDVPIQLPINILNQTFAKTIKNPDNQLFDFTARSLMLQGILDWESKKNPFKNHPSVIKLKRLGKLMGLKPIELAVNFAKQLNVNSCVFGFATIKQINDFFYYWNSTTNLEIDFSEFNSPDKNLYDVRRW
jgi:aryl-alcohol dehydrogenase-like predicted oxidoreductase